MPPEEENHPHNHHQRELVVMLVVLVGLGGSGGPGGGSSGPSGRGRGEICFYTSAWGPYVVCRTAVAPLAEDTPWAWPGTLVFLEVFLGFPWFSLVL